MKTAKIIVPQYHSCYCENNCKYCGFKKSNAILSRKRLSFEEFKTELELLISWGYRTVEFVFSSDIYFTSDEIAKRVECAKEIGLEKGFDLRIGMNADPLSYNDYRRLKSAGLDFFVLWMETYSKEMYGFWHCPETPKSNYTYRYESYGRALDAGIEKYGMGVLF